MLKDKVHFSNMSGKLKFLRAINTDTTTNPFCMKQKTNKKSICSFCYSWYMLETFRKNCVDAFASNSILLSTTCLKSNNNIPFIIDAYLRINGHGELINTLHLHNIVNIALFNPHCNIAVWTKRKDLINKYFKENDKPKNLILVFSNPKINHIKKDIPQHFDKVFNNVEENSFIDEQNCTGQECYKCLQCYKFEGENIIVEKVKEDEKYQKHNLKEAS